jgi:hypothetical protein
MSAITEYLKPLPTGKNEAMLRDLAEKMNAGLKQAKRGTANYWKSGDASIERVYVSNQTGKKAGYVEAVEGKGCFYRECAAEDLIAIFRAARKAQKATA